MPGHPRGLRGGGCGGLDRAARLAGVADVLREALAPAQETLRREVNPDVYPALEFSKKAAAGELFAGI